MSNANVNANTARLARLLFFKEYDGNMPPTAVKDAASNAFDAAEIFTKEQHKRQGAAIIDEAQAQTAYTFTTTT